MDSETLEVHDAKTFEIIVGATKKHDDVKGQKLTVKDVYPHPDFKGHKTKLHHDVGILRLNSRIEMGGANTELIKLPPATEETPVGRRITVSGWGRNPQHPRDPEQETFVPSQNGN